MPIFKIADYLNLILRIGPLVAEVVSQVEDIYGDAMEGKIKKEKALSLIRKGLDGFEMFFGGGPELQEKVLEYAGISIDLTVTAYNKYGLWEKTYVVDFSPIDPEAPGIEIKITEATPAKASAEGQVTAEASGTVEKKEETQDD